ncbi:MAG: 2'-5' RNA ligase family protein [Propionibacteriales bacterium]|nr:2'-5' RNA ligase family protein [Propionibacteriales bacterium]
MALAVCMLFDDRADRALRALWDRLEDLGVATLRSHTHGRHVPHLSYAVVRDGSLGPLETRAAVAALPDEGPIDLNFDGLGTFRRGGSWLVPAVTADLAHRQGRVAAAVYDVLPLHARAVRAAVIESGAGESWPLPNLP